MKKKIIISVISSLLLSGTVYAASINGDYNGNPIVKVKVNGNLVDSEVPAQIVDGTTLLPLRSVSQALGADVKWNQDTYSVDVNISKAVVQDDYKKFASLAYLCVYLEKSTQYIHAFSGGLDQYSKGKLTSSQIYSQYDESMKKVNEIYQTALSVNAKVANPEYWGDLNEIIKNIYSINDTLVDAYKDDVAYVMSLTQSPSVSDDLYKSYIGKVESATNLASTTIDSIRKDYELNMKRIM